MIADDKVRLRPPREEDFPLLELLRNDMDTQQSLLSQPRPNSITRVREWITQASDRPDGVFFVIEFGGKTAGFIQLREIEQLHGTARLGVALVKEARGKGLGGHAIRLLEAYAFNVFGVRKLVLSVLASNAAAIRLYEKAGYRTVGTLVEHAYFNGRRHDVVIMEHLHAQGPQAAAR